MLSQVSQRRRAARSRTVAVRQQREALESSNQTAATTLRSNEAESLQQQQQSEEFTDDLLSIDDEAASSFDSINEQELTSSTIALISDDALYQRRNNVIFRAIAFVLALWSLMCLSLGKIMARNFAQKKSAAGGADAIDCSSCPPSSDSSQTDQHFSRLHQQAADALRRALDCDERESESGKAENNRRVGVAYANAIRQLDLAIRYYRVLSSANRSGQLSDAALEKARGLKAKMEKNRRLAQDRKLYLERKHSVGDKRLSSIVPRESKPIAPPQPQQPRKRQASSDERRGGNPIPVSSKPTLPNRPTPLTPPKVRIRNIFVGRTRA